MRCGRHQTRCDHVQLCEKGGQWQRDLIILDQCVAAGIKPNVIKYNATISACEKGGQWQPALIILDQCVAAGIKPNAITYTAAISWTC